MKINSSQLAGLRILVTNDDGIHGPGLKVLERIAQGLSPDVWVVAPAMNQSGVGHGISIVRPLRIREFSPRRFSVDGTPADCVALALEHILKDQPPDLILSGINEGANVGDDVTYSGTLGAAMEGTFHKIRSIAFSLEMEKDTSPKWSTVEHFAPQIIRKLLSFKWLPGTFISVNIPDASVTEIQGTRIVGQGHHSPGQTVHPILDHWGNECYWVGSINRIPEAEEGTDLAMIAEKMIAITPLSLNLTHLKMLEELRLNFS